MDLFMSNVGDAQALLIQSEGGHRVITRKHDPAETLERARIREAGGYVSRQGKLNDQLDVSRAFGYVSQTPCVIAAPHVVQVTLKESDEMILMASRELWDYLTPDFAVDVARSERGDLMRAAQKLRDLAIAFGATGKIMVMMVGVTDLRRRERARVRTHSMGMGPSGSPQLDYFSGRKGKRGRENVGDSKLARLDQEVEAPVGDVTLVFTDIKNSTILWETYPIAMRSAIRMHNEVMRRHLRIIGGYEVKTEGDAFMVAFPTVTSALLWCFTIQSQLLEVQWPQEILSSVHGDEVQDADGNIIFRGLSVRMGIHWGQPVSEVDPVTKRMDYFGPMVNRAARIEGVADGGQICVSSDSPKCSACSNPTSRPTAPTRPAAKRLSRTTCCPNLSAANCALCPRKASKSRISDSALSRVSRTRNTSTSCTRTAWRRACWCSSKRQRRRRATMPRRTR
jgi:adenylate cyclase